MTDSIARVNGLLPEYRQRRTRFCGAPMPRMIRSDGTNIDGATFRCGDRFCAHCARLRAQRVYACILRAVSGTLAHAGASRGVMVTLTHRKPSGLSESDLVFARQLQAKIQRETHARLRAHDAAWRRIARQTAECGKPTSRALIARANESIPVISKFYTKGGTRTLETLRADIMPAASTGGRTTYIWAREVTAGGGSTYDGWHCHVHYLVPNESDAVRLVSAHLAACRQLGVSARPDNQIISRPDRATFRDGGAGAADAANYITHYITKSGVDDMGDDVLSAYIRGMRGARQYDAAGDWRPIGIGRRLDDGRPRVTHVREMVRCYTRDGEVVERELTREFRDFMAQKTPYWQQMSVGGLNQYTTKFEPFIFPEKTIRLAEKFGVGFRLPRKQPDIDEIVDIFGGDDGFSWVEVETC